MDKQFVKVSFTKAVLYVYTFVYIDISVYTYEKRLLKKKVLKGMENYHNSVGKL